MNRLQFDQIKRRLAALNTTHLCDADKNIRALDPAIRPVGAAGKLIGIAHTAQCCDDFLTVIKALQAAAEGEVLVIDGQGGRKALAGELFTTEAARRKLAGIVIDGAVRDTAGLPAIGLPVYARLIHPVSGFTTTAGKTRIPVSCGGVTVNPGDVVFGDQDGLIVASGAELAHLLPRAEEIQQKEARVLSRMRAGESLLDLINFDEHCSALQAGRPSALQFKV